MSANDLVKIEELGRGAYGVVEEMRHQPTGLIFAVKVFITECKQNYINKFPNKLANSFLNQ